MKRTICVVFSTTFTARTPFWASLWFGVSRVEAKPRKGLPSVTNTPFSSVAHQPLVYRPLSEANRKERGLMRRTRSALIGGKILDVLARTHDDKIGRSCSTP